MQYNPSTFPKIISKFIKQRKTMAEMSSQGQLGQATPAAEQSKSGTHTPTTHRKLT
jgi:hypothetical protein